MKSFKDYTILVADDEEMLRKVIAFDFTRKGFNVLLAESGVEALGLVQANKIDLIISDIRMPGGDGVTLLEKIRITHPHVPALIFVTGFSDITEAECIAKGALQVIAKPFDRKALMNAVFGALGLSEKAVA